MKLPPRVYRQLVAAAVAVAVVLTIGWMRKQGSQPSQKPGKHGQRHQR